MIVSRNHGRVIVPPHWRDGQLVPGYTRNGPGEGPSKQRKQPLEMRCIERPISGTDQPMNQGQESGRSARSGRRVEALPPQGPPAREIYIPDLDLDSIRAKGRNFR